MGLAPLFSVSRLMTYRVLRRLFAANVINQGIFMYDALTCMSDNGAICRGPR